MTDRHCHSSDTLLEPVVFALAWPVHQKMGTVNHRTVFETEHDAGHYRAMCARPNEIEVVALYLPPAPEGE